MSSFGNNAQSPNGHFRQFFGNSLTGARNSHSVASNLSSIQMPPQQAKKSTIDLESFSKHITCSPSWKQGSNDTTTLNASINYPHKSTSSQNVSKLAYQQDSLLSYQKDNQNSLESSLVGSININNSSKISQPSNINSRTLQLQRQFFFNGPERFENDKNSNYYGRSTINPLVDTRQYATSSIEDINYSKLFDKSEQKYDSTKLHMKTENLIAPKNRIMELNEVKEHQKLLKEWKQDHQLKSKQFKLAKAAFKSGISHVDGPLSETTQIYSKEHENFIKKELDENKRREVRLSYIEKFVSTNPAILFDNSTSNKQFETKKHLFPHQVDDFQNGFMRKNKSELASSRNAQTFDRLFGHNLQDQKQIINSTRSKFLMSKDLYGKSQNIISNTLNPSLRYAV